jgi:hypothetical protein
MPTSIVNYDDDPLSSSNGQSSASAAFPYTYDYHPQIAKKKVLELAKKLYDGLLKGSANDTIATTAASSHIPLQSASKFHNPLYQTNNVYKKHNSEIVGLHEGDIVDNC